MSGWEYVLFINLIASQSYINDKTSCFFLSNLLLSSRNKPIYSIIIYRTREVSLYIAISVADIPNSILAGRAYPL